MNSALIKTSVNNSCFGPDAAVVAAAAAAAAINSQHAANVAANVANGATNGTNGSTGSGNNRNENGTNGSNGQNNQQQQQQQQQQNGNMNSPVRTFSPPSPYTTSVFHRDMRRHCNSMNTATGNSHHVSVSRTQERASNGETGTDHIFPIETRNYRIITIARPMSTIKMQVFLNFLAVVPIRRSMNLINIQCQWCPITISLCGGVIQSKICQNY